MNKVKFCPFYSRNTPQYKTLVEVRVSLPFTNSFRLTTLTLFYKKSKSESRHNNEGKKNDLYKIGPLITTSPWQMLRDATETGNSVNEGIDGNKKKVTKNTPSLELVGRLLVAGRFMHCEKNVQFS